MKAFLLVCLAAAVFAEPEADPYLLSVQSPLVSSLLHQPVVYKQPAVVKQVVQQPIVYKQQVAVQQPLLHVQQPLVYYNPKQPVVHKSERLEGPGGVVPAMTQVNDGIFSYKVQEKINKREAESDAESWWPRTPLASTYGVLPTTYGYPAINNYGLAGVYNYGINTPLVSNVGYRLAKREAESEPEADPAVLLNAGLYQTALPAASLVSNVRPVSYIQRPVVASQYIQRPVVTSPYTLGYNWY